ncbi:serine/threonine protein kinase [Pseudomonadales bacterium]|nr:serine/threonine protein kinase [Pseudomonadales bacterium]
MAATGIDERAINLTPKEYARVKEIFTQAIAMEPEARDAYIAKTAETDEAMIAQVRSLLEHHVEETVLDASDAHDTVNGDIVLDAAPESDTFLVQKDVWEDNRQILRRRLMIIATVMTIIITVSTVDWFLSATEETDYIARLIAFVISLTAAVILYRNQNLSLLQIRIAELLVMANVGLLAIDLDIRMTCNVVEAGKPNMSTMLASINNWNYVTWSLIIFIYGVFMPNRWQRAACVLLPMAAAPYLVTELTAVIVAEQYGKNIQDLMHNDLLGRPLSPPLIAACISIFAAHTIHGARTSAFQARRLAQYRLIDLIGEGGMGRVYKAEHLLLKRSCAIKLIQPDKNADARALRRFEREVRATAQLTHPHTVQVYDYGQTNEGIFFFAMELLPGMNLGELIKKTGPLPPERAVHFLIQVSDALREAHEVGLIHRDIKPGNLFISERGGIKDYTKLLDFGVVREVKVDPSLSQTAIMVAGTPSFMAPEQATHPEQTDARSDIYSLGMVGYYMLTSQVPFKGQTPIQIMMAQVNETPAPPSAHQSGIPADVEAIILKCLEKKPEDRIASAVQLRDALIACKCSRDWTAQRASQWWNEQKPSPTKIDKSSRTKIS